MNPEPRDPERLDLMSASQLEIVAECPGMINLRASIPAEQLAATRSDQDDEWAEYGTRLHHAFETGNTLELNPTECEAYQTGLKYAEQIKAKWIHDKALDPEKVTEGPRELRVWAFKPYSYPDLMGSGKLDRHFIYRDKDRVCLLILDYKGGFNPNLPASNRSWQLAFQAVLLWKEEYDNVTDVRVAYVKVKDKCEPGDFCDYTAIDLQYKWEGITYAAWMSTQPDAPRRAGKHCRWCDARAGHCPEALAYAILPSVIAKNVWGKKDVAQSVNEVTHADLLKVWRMGPMIKNILEGVKTRLETLSEQELTDLGLELGPGRKTKDVTRMQEAFIHLRDVAGWPEEQIWAVMRFVTKHMVTYLGNKGSDEKAAKAWIETTLKPFATEKTGDKILREIKG